MKTIEEIEALIEKTTAKYFEGITVKFDVDESSRTNTITFKVVKDSLYTTFLHFTKNEVLLKFNDSWAIYSVYTLAAELNLDRSSTSQLYLDYFKYLVI